MFNLFMPIQVTHFCQQKGEVAVAESCSGSGHWVQEGSQLLIDGASLRRPLETTRKQVLGVSSKGK